MSYAIIGFGNIGQALAKAFARCLIFAHLPRFDSKYFIEGAEEVFT